MLDASFIPETAAQLDNRRALVDLLLHTTDARDLTDAELLILIPSHAPVRHPQNRARACILNQLNAAGFTWRGKRLA